MNHCGFYIHKFLKLTLLGLIFPLFSLAQNSVDIDALEQPVKSLLEKYVYLSGEIRPDIEPDPARPFIQLFRAARSEVYNDLNVLPGREMISIHDYCELIKVQFPDGLITNIETDNIKIEKIPEDPDSRMVVNVRVKKRIEGMHDDQAYQKITRVIFMIGFDLVDGEYRNFLIHGISPVVEHDQDITFTFSPGYSRIYNKDLIRDARFDLNWESSWRAGINYSYMLKPSWGLGIGLNTSVNKHSLLLDKIDPLNDHDPNIVDVEWFGEFYYLEIPIYFVYQYKASKRIFLEADIGGFAGLRIFEEIVSFGRNRHSGLEMDGVVSDPFAYSNISKLDMGLQMDLGLKVAVSQKISILVQFGLKQGLTSLEKDVDLDFVYSKYQGQFNPMFYKNTTSNFSQVIYGKLGLTYRLNGSNYIN